MAGLKYRWKISPKKSYSCSLIAAPQVSNGHLNCAPVPSAEHVLGHDDGLADVDVLGRGEQGPRMRNNSSNPTGAAGKPRLPPTLDAKENWPRLFALTSPSPVELPGIEPGAEIGFYLLKRAI
jgi:hypothetical protein